MEPREELSDFLRSRRGRLTPDELGLRSYGPRRVPGLRREELAQLAGVSVDYYTRLEQGRGVHPSRSVLDAIARALQLDQPEASHLRRLAAPQSAPRRKPPPERVRPGVRLLLKRLDRVAALVLGRRMDVLAWNSLAAVLICDFGALPRRERNMVRLTFLDESFRSLYPEWDGVAASGAGLLRSAAGRWPDDPELEALVGELSVKSNAFIGAWARHEVREQMSGTKRINHPLVGELTLLYETLALPDEPEQQLVTYTAQADTESQTALDLLASIAAQPERAAAHEPDGRA
ncbi:MAG: transcriptional regulator [Solirubrobacterales bacterium]|nr:transcriptional regulator [Solirubrobacterales bacterium]